MGSFTITCQGSPRRCSLNSPGTPRQGYPLTPCVNNAPVLMSVVKISITDNNFSNEWPRVARGLCHWCCHRFGTVPVCLPVWGGTRYHLHGLYCSWNCAKSELIARTRAGTFPAALTALTVFAFRTSFCAHETPCVCHARFTGVVPAPPKETLQAFGGNTTITQFRRGAMTIPDFSRIERLYRPRVLCSGTRINPRYLYTFEPRRRVQLLEVEDEDPVVLIRRRVW